MVTLLYSIAKRYMYLLGVAAIAVLLIGCTSNSTSSQTKATTPTPTATLAPTPTSTPAAQVLYQANWSHGLGDWKSEGPWKAVGGNLQIDATGDFSLTAPYTSTVSNYAIELRFRITNVTVSGGGLSITVDHIAGKDGYMAGILRLLGPGPHVSSAHPECLATIDPFSSMDPNTEQVHDCEPYNFWHVLRTEVHGSAVLFYMDDVRSSYASSTVTSHLSGGPIHISGSKANIEISSFRVLTL